MSNPNPRRSTQGSPLTSLQHDDIHTRDRNDIDALTLAVNTLIAGSGIPTGVVLYTGSSTLDSGFLWGNGSAQSRTTYASLFARYGTTYGSGDGTTTFNLPKLMGRVVVVSNPLGGQTDGTLTTRTLGTYFGVETASYTPAGSVPTVQGSITGAPGKGTLASNVSATNDPMSGSLTVINGAMTGALTVGGGILSGAPGIGTLAVSAVAGGNVTGVSCVNVNGETGSTSVIACGTLSFAPTGGVLSGVPGVGSLAVSAVTVGLGSLASAVTVGLGTLASNVSVTNGAITGAPTAGTLATNVSASFSGTPAVIVIMQPAVVLNAIIKY